MKDLILIGASLIGAAVWHELKERNPTYRVISFADNDKNKQGKRFHGLPVISVEDAVHSGVDLVLSTVYSEEIVKQLGELGCEKYFKFDEILTDNVDINEMESLVIGKFFNPRFNNNHCGELEKNKVVFSCNSFTTVLTAYFLASGVYAGWNKVMLLSSRCKYADKLREITSDIWDEICYFNDSYYIIETGLDALTEIIGTPEVFHFFSPGTIVYSQIIKLLSDKTRLILTDEGTATYDARTNDPFMKVLDLNRINEIQVYNPELIMYNPYNLPVTKIPVKLDSIQAVLKEINPVVSYSESRNDIGSDIIYFDQPLGGSHIPKEKETKFLTDLYHCMRDRKFSVKIHPSSKVDKYTSFNLKIIDGLPWDLIRFNQILANKDNRYIYITVASTAAFFDYIAGLEVSKGNSIVILLDKIMRKYHDTDNGSYNGYNIDIARKMDEKINSDSVVRPGNWSEVEKVLLRIVKSS